MPAVKPGRVLSYAAWEEELGNDQDKDFILHGIKNVDIVDITASPIAVEIDNYRSAHPDSPLHDKATQQIFTEIENSNYKVCDTKPPLISPFSVIEKPDGGVRPIHDGSQPEGASMNDYATLDMHLHF